MVLLKFFAFFLTLGVYLVTSPWVALACYVIKKPRVLEANTRLFCRILGYLFGLKPSVELSQIDWKQNYLMLSNHLSYLDVFCLISQFPCTFVTSFEVKNDWFLGTVCRLAGCEFVDRQSRTTLRRDLQKISNILRSGRNVILFPEGTTSNGSEVLPFKRSLIQAAVSANVPILPLCINYRNVDGAPVTPENGDRIFWYGDMPFFPHFLKILNVRAISADIHALSPIPVDGSSCRKDLTQTAYQLIRNQYIQIV